MNFGATDSAIYIVAAAGLTIMLVMAGTFLQWRAVGKIPSSMIRYLPARRATRQILVLLSVLLFAVTALRPRWGYTERELPRRGTDILVLLDVSNSMLAEDITPSRMDRAKRAVEMIASSLKGDRIGIILYAGEAFLQCPFTADYGAFRMFLDAAEPGAVPLQGTAIAEAMEKAAAVFSKKEMRDRVVILVTDGEDHEGKVMKALDDLKSLGTTVHTVSVGTEKGKPLQLDADHYLRDRTGSIVRSAADRDLLEKIARNGNGLHVSINSSYSGIGKIIRSLPDQEDNGDEKKTVREPIERYQIFALVLLLFIVVEPLIAERNFYTSYYIGSLFKKGGEK